MQLRIYTGVCMYYIYVHVYLLEIFADVTNLFHNLTFLNTHLLITRKPYICMLYIVIYNIYFVLQG